jgi:hypothetical protein
VDIKKFILKNSTFLKFQKKVLKFKKKGSTHLYLRFAEITSFSDLSFD